MTMKQLFKNQYVYSLFTKCTIAFLGISETVFLNRYLGPSLKGEFAFVLNIVNIMVLILNLGIYQSYPFFKRKLIENIKNEYFNIIIFQFIVYLLIGLVAEIFLRNMSYLIIVILGPIMILSSQLSFIALVEDINLRNKLSIGNELFYAVSLFFIFIFAPQSIWYIFALLIIKDIVIILRIIYKFGFKLSLRSLDFRLMKETIKFGIYPMITMLLITLNYKADIIILGFFVDYEQIGYYTIGVGLANMVWLIPDAFKDVLFAKTSKKDSIDDIKFSIKFNFYVSLVIIGIIIIGGRFIINLLYGPDFLTAYPVTTVIFIGILPMIFYKMIVSLFNAKGKQKVSFYILLIAVIFNIIGNFILIPQFGIIGSAVASVISYSICGVVFTYIFLKDFNVKVHELFIFDTDEIQRLKKIIVKKK